MKKVLAIILILTISFALVSCNNQIIEGKEAWQKFASALEYTTALEYYSIDKTISIDGIKKSEKIVLTKNDKDKYVAYKKTADNVEQFYYNGDYYFTTGGKKVKKAININDFLDIGDSEIVWTLDMASNIKYKVGRREIEFEIAMQKFEQCKVTAKLGKIFLSSITVSVIKNVDGKQVKEQIAYVYNNVGDKPQLSLPSDLSEYQY